MADMFQGIANKFLDMAMQIIQDAITQQLMKLFTNLFGSGLPAGLATSAARLAAGPPSAPSRVAATPATPRVRAASTARAATWPWFTLRPSLTRSRWGVTQARRTQVASVVAPSDLRRR